MHHKDRPVRLYNRLVEDTVPNDKPPRPRRTREPSPMEEIAYKLEVLSTQQLRALCIKECPGVSLRMGPGARERFLKALVINRLDRRKREKDKDHGDVRRVRQGDSRGHAEGADARVHRLRRR